MIRKFSKRIHWDLLKSPYEAVSMLNSVFEIEGFAEFVPPELACVKILYALQGGPGAAQVCFIGHLTTPSLP